MEVLTVAFLWKACVTAIVIIAVTACAERAGSTLAALLMGMPLSIGPALALIAYSHGSEFVVAAANYSLAGVVGVVLFIVAYVRSAPRLGLWIGLLISYCTWLVSALVLGSFHLNFTAALVLAVAALIAGRWLIPRAVPTTPRRVPTPVFYVLIRGVLAGVIVSTVVTFAPLLGPQLAGFFATVPVILGSVAWMLATLVGPNAAIATLSHSDRGLPSFLIFCAIVAVAAEPLSAAVALTIGVAVSVIVSATLASLAQRQARR